MNIHTYIEYAKRNKINNRLSRALSQRIYLIESSFEVVPGRFKYEEKPNKVKLHTYHNTDCTDCSETTCKPLYRGELVKLTPHSCVLNPVTWNLQVQGSSHSKYKVTSSTTHLKCTCIDFNRNKGNLCKHIYYIYFKVLGYDVDVLKNYDNFNAPMELKREIYFKLCEHFFGDKFKNTPEEKKIVEEKKATKDDLCCVCYDLFGEEPLSECAGACHGIFHTDCIQLWQSRSSACPLCRQSLSIKSVTLKEFAPEKHTEENDGNAKVEGCEAEEPTLMDNDSKEQVQEGQDKEDPGDRAASEAKIREIIKEDAHNAEALEAALNKTNISSATPVPQSRSRGRSKVEPLVTDDIEPERDEDDNSKRYGMRNREKKNYSDTNTRKVSSNESKKETNTEKPNNNKKNDVRKVDKNTKVNGKLANPIEDNKNSSKQVGKSKIDEKSKKVNKKDIDKTETENSNSKGYSLRTRKEAVNYNDNKTNNNLKRKR